MNNVWITYYMMCRLFPKAAAEEDVDVFRGGSIVRLHLQAHVQQRVQPLVPLQRDILFDHSHVHLAATVARQAAVQAAGGPEVQANSESEDVALVCDSAANPHVHADRRGRRGFRSICDFCRGHTTSHS